jgi:exopolysaccharide biosynthesis polyprenyl glycosylphosphotransferase
MHDINSRKTFPWLILTSDVIGLLICFNTAFLLRVERLMFWNSLLSYLIISLCLLGLYIGDTYRLDKYTLNLFDRLTPARVLLSLAITFGITSSLIYLTGLWGKQPITGRGILLLGTIFFAIWAISSRLLAARWLGQKIKQCRWLVIGSSPEILQLEQEYCVFSSRAEFVFWSEHPSPSLIQENPSLCGGLDKLDFLSQQSWSGVLIERTNKTLSDSAIAKLMAMRLQGTIIYELSAFYERFWEKIPPSILEKDWFTFSSGFSLLHNRLDAKIKRLLDVAIAAFLLVLLFPLMGAIALTIKLDSRGSIFYSQVRTGLNGKTFRVHKFRSMYQDAEKRGIQWASQKDPRITRVGNWLRIVRLDELPQLWNVLKGEMTLIGPRPERPEFDRKLREEIPHYDLRYLVKPGITGWAQVNYPYGASVEDAYQKVAYDFYYIKNYSLLLDAIIVLKTIRVVFLGKGR